MKTTIEIADALLDEAKEFAASHGVTLRALVERGLRRVLAESKTADAFRLRDASFRGEGLQPDLADSPWSEIRDRAYEGRGA
jgi:hypothetical protein